MALPVSVPYTFGNTTTQNSLPNLDTNFSTIYTAVNGIGNGTNSLSNAVATATGSTTARTLANRFNDIVNVLDWGASPANSAAANSSAIAAAINSVASTGGVVYFPPGVYSSTPISLSNINNVSLIGADRQSSTLSLTTTGTLLTFNNAQNCCLTQIAFSLSGTAQSIAGTTGVIFTGGSGNCEVNGCWFTGFANDGLDFTGTSGVPLSGCQTIDCIFVGNGGNQLCYTYSNDFRILNNQYGSLVGVTHAAIGCYLNNSSAGLYQGNYHWQNIVGFKAQSCSYNTYALNRFEINDQQGAYLTGGYYNQFTGNKLYSNSQSSNGAYDNFYSSSWSGAIVSENWVFTWDATNSRWGMYFDTGCNDVALKNNKVAPGSFGSSYGPYNVDAADDSNVYGDFQVVSCTSSAVSGGVTTYLGPVGASYSEGQASFQIAKRCAVLRFWVGVDNPPGAGQTFTYSVRINNVTSSMTGTISGASSYVAIVYNTTPGLLVPINSTINIVLTTSSGAAAVNHRYYIEFLEY